MHTLAANILSWAHDRNLIEGSNSQAQMVKLMEEIGELAGGIAKQKPDVIKDSIGDAIVVLTILAAQNNLKLVDCMRAAYDEIKDRKGQMINGVFVKEETPVIPVPPEALPPVEETAPVVVDSSSNDVQSLEELQSATIGEDAK